MNFQAYELLFDSEIWLPGYKDQTICNKQVDVVIKYQTISPLGIQNPCAQGLFFQVNPDEMWLHVPDIARFLVQRGREILVDCLSSKSEDILGTFLNGPCMAALLMQRGLLVLMGGVLQFGEHAMAYLGESSTGKTSLMAAMLSQGYRLISDNLCVITEQGYVLPGSHYIELYEDVMKQLNFSINENHIIKPGMKKYRLCMQPAHEGRTLPLSKIYILHPRKKDVLSIKTLRGSEKINHLQKNIFNKLYVNGMQNNRLYFNLVTQLALKISVVMVEFNGMTFNPREISHYVNASD